MDMLIQTFINGTMGSLILILVASGLCMIFGIMHIVNFAHGEFYMLGGFGAWLFFDQEVLPLFGPPAFRYILSVILTMVAVAFIGIIVERVLLRRFRGSLQSILVVTFGLMLIMQASTLIIFGVTDKAFSSPFQGYLSLGNFHISQERMAAIITSIVIMLMLYFFINKTKYGKAMRAVAQDAEAALVLGMNFNLIFSLAMGIGCALAAVGGALVGPIFYVNPYMGVAPVMKAFVVIILGGAGSLLGAVIGGFVVGMTEAFVSTYFGTHFAIMAVFLILIFILLVKPTGVFGHEE
ncbi:MAG: branched-chain amino acid ABC transporter permease [Deltaproteobacteria bacterium]|nr:branched-chain amino acid ABC transporter permease [Deltaproteobacteria bacterium]MBT6611573.1 branched-chain amino acid ABC transporter permease [Deltaproteobacteria bacterium]MBT7892852.1 branched-chain amino acid ABC transporter permease [Deltaproteobacteria bacterium]